MSERPETASSGTAMAGGKPWAPHPEDRALAIRTCKPDMAAYNGFQWPQSGYVEAPDWSDARTCGQGLHGLLDGRGDWLLTSEDSDAKWLVVEVSRSECVDLKGKVKFPRCNVLYAGGMARAMTLMGDWLVKHLLAAGDSSATVTSGSGGRLAASGNDSNLAASGSYSNLAASGSHSVAMCAGFGSRAKAGPNGVIALTWWDESAHRPRVVVAYVGEGGVKPNTWYGVDTKGNLVETA